MKTRALTHETAVALLGAAMDQINAQRKKSERVQPTPSTVLVGAGAVLDSLLLLSFIVAVEERLRDDHDAEVTLVDLIGQAPETSPLRTFGALAEHLVAVTGTS